jgi:hypothetical protein
LARFSRTFSISNNTAGRKQVRARLPPFAPRVPIDDETQGVEEATRLAQI